MHCLYMCLLFTYNNYIYIKDVEAPHHGLTEKPIRSAMELALIVGVLYPACYDFV